MSIGLRLILAVAIESCWELIENTDFLIDRYRGTTVALDYYGDSVINSVSDVLFMVFGYFLASRLPVWLTVGIAVGLELFLDPRLTLNVLMLLWPVDAILQWQNGS